MTTPTQRNMMHLTGAHLRTAKTWRKHRDVHELDIVFDVYGILDSNVLLKEQGREEFRLRDHTDSVIVSYYPIDAPFPVGVQRGEWIKVSCVWRSWGLQAVRVLPAEQGFAIHLETKVRNSLRALDERLYASNRTKWNSR